ncbi:hypothetical protein BHQ17_04525 [Mycolicibacterium holsaticum]|uniref:Antitoxin VbhA domain-containing protein n=2 Tax=Mycolicibacterium holsaticum TaxID=152142 RepID=A0A1E3S1G9_9MYCO|nr:hypothetical protein BHQ17_04525 [Mycolicibacterium holsaticum]
MSTMTTAPKVSPLSHDDAVAMAVTASALAGHDPSPAALELLERIGRGELTVDEAVAEVVAEFSRPAE